MQKNDNDMIIAEGKDLFNRVVSIFEQARVYVVRAVNSNIVIAYSKRLPKICHIGSGEFI